MPHADTCEQKGMQAYERACAHKKRSEISAEKRFFGLVARRVRRVFHGCPSTYAALRVRATCKSVLLSPTRSCDKTFSCLTPGRLALLHVLTPPSFLQHYISSLRMKREGVKNWKRFLLISAHIEDCGRKTSKAAKNGSPKNEKRTQFLCVPRY